MRVLKHSICFISLFNPFLHVMKSHESLCTFSLMKQGRLPLLDCIQTRVMGVVNNPVGVVDDLIV